MDAATPTVLVPMAADTAAAPAVALMTEMSVASTWMLDASMPDSTPVPSPSILERIACRMRFSVYTPAPLSPTAFLPAAMAAETAATIESTR